MLFSMQFLDFVFHPLQMNHFGLYAMGIIMMVLLFSAVEIPGIWWGKCKQNKVWEYKTLIAESMHTNGDAYKMKFSMQSFAWLAPIGRAVMVYTFVIGCGQCLAKSSALQKYKRQTTRKYLGRHSYSRQKQNYPVHFSLAKS